ncbi:MAG: Ig-like domain-containing protein [Thermoflexales bacterium]|nr:Ig-like domain-containing protein [Thermoflexales bacterium]
MNRVRPIACSVLVLSVLLTAWLARPTGALPAPSARAKVEAAWQRANDVGDYHYATEIVQTTWPELVLESVGLSSQTERLYIEGDTDVAAHSMNLKLWGDGGNTATNDGAVELRISNGKTEGRVGASSWKELDDVSSLFAPGQDPLAYLAGAKDIVELGTETRGGQVSVTRYGFQLDGPAFAAHMRDLMEEELVRRGELPPGVTLELARTYVGMTGEGEIWLDSLGLPLRQIIHANFPPQYGQQVEVKIATDFSKWADQAAKKSQPGVTGFLLPTPYSLFPLLLLAATLSLVILLISLPSRLVYNAVALAVIAAMLVTPLMQGQRLYAFSEKQAAANTKADQDRQAAQQRQELQASVYTKDFDPHKDPLSHPVTPSPRHPVTLSPDPCDSLTGDPGTDTDGDGLTDAQEACINTNAGAADTDGDGLSDGTEVYELGTNPWATDDDRDGVPDGRDSDGDGIGDGAEVRGFWDASGKRWYSNPLDADTNGDGIGDIGEFPYNEDGDLDCPDPDGDGVPTCPPQDVDTDRDGTPDGFDFDDDNDGVPDRIDEARTAAAGSLKDGRIAGLPGGRFDFEIQDVRVNTPLYVDFQLRPANPDHLWYTMNVLDWPSEDAEGQVQRVLDTTFGASGKDANGDMRLVPMLEIAIPYRAGHYGNLPVLPGAPPIQPSTPVTAWLDTAQTDMFNISVRKLNNAGDLAAYVPLVLVQDPAGGSPVAMAARMFYWPSVARADQPGLADGGPAQSARLVWLIQAKTDTCRLPVPDSFRPAGQDETQRYQSWCSDPANRIEGETLVHTYYDDWYLTGFSVREDRGLRTGIVFEDPDYALAHDYNASTYYESYLWGMAADLDETFIAARSQDTNGDGQGDERDMTLDEIWTRFNVSSTVTQTLRWGIPAGATQVLTQAFAHQSYMAHLPMTTTRQVLGDYFSPGGQPTAVKIANPTLLFVREETFRALTLDGAASSATVQNGVLLTNTLKMVLDSDRAPETVIAGMNWAPYTYNTHTAAWEADPVDEYVAKLKARLGLQFEADEYFLHDKDIVEGAKLVAGSFYLALFVGLTSVVELNGAPLTMPYAQEDANISYSLAGTAGSITRFIIGEVSSQVFFGYDNWWSLGHRLMDSTLFVKVFGTGGSLEVLDLLKKTGQEAGGASGYLAQIWTGQSFLGRAGKPLLIGGAIVALAAFAYCAGYLGVETVMQYVSTALTMYYVYSAISGVCTAVKAAGSLKAVLTTVSNTIPKASKCAGVIGFIVVALVAIGFFVYGMVSGGIQAGSLEFDRALANLVASLIVTAIMFALYAIPVIGPLVVALVGLIDLAIMWACAATGADQEEGWVKEYVCGGITGALTKLVEFLIYSQSPVVDLQAPDRLNPTNFSVNVSDLSKGMSVGNRLSIGADVITTLYRKPPSGLLGLLVYGITILDLDYNDTKMKESTFKYAFTLDEAKLPGESLDRMWGWWQPASASWWDGKRFTVTQHIDNGGNVVLTQAGLNWQPTLYLAENYAVNALECALIACWYRPMTDTLHIDLGDSFKFDVFPATLDGFYTLESRGDKSYALAWDRRFPTLADADGDGLRSKARGGNDPDDGLADSDLDGLSDYYEVQHGLKTDRPDSDGDGLSDYEDVARGTRPDRADSDGDGLSDKQELDGWLFAYAFDSHDQPLFTRVTSDPHNPDTDNDGITDPLEQAYHFNPRAYSLPEVMTVSSAIDDADGYVRPGQAIAYTATVENKLRDLYALGLLEVDFPAAVQNDSIAPLVYTLPPREQIALHGQVTVRPGITRSQSLSLTNRAGASLTDLPGEAGGRVLWLRLNESGAGDARFVDDSLEGNAGTCSGSSCPTAGLPGYTGLAARFDGVDDAIVLSDTLALPARGPLTLMAWIKPQATDLTRTILSGYSQAGQAWLRIDNGSYEVGSGMTYTARYTVPAGDLGQWTHLAGVYDGSAWILYRNGEEVSRRADTTSTVPVNGDWAVGARGDGGGEYFSGLVDEVSVYPRALDDREVAAQVQRPGFKMSLDSRTCAGLMCSYQDEIGQLQGTCYHTGSGSENIYCPSPTPGVLRGGMVFDNGRVFALPQATALDLSDGHFSQVMWIRPEATTSHRQGVLGYSPQLSGDAAFSPDAYPSILITNTDDLELGLGDGSVWRSCVVTDVLSLNQWNHLAVTYDDGQYKVYVDGVDKGSCTLGAGVKPGSTSNLEVGRVTGCATMKDNGLTCYAVQGWDQGFPGNNELRGKFADEDIWYHDWMDAGDPGLHNVTRNYCGAASLEVWEEDIWPDTHDFVNRYTFKITTPSFSQEVRFQGNEVDVGLALTHINPSVPFKGGLDELAIYKRALSAQEVLDLYQGTERLLELRLDEAPGRSVFSDSSGNAHVGTCDDNAGKCPDSGLPGRFNQAARFDGQNDTIDVTVNVLESEYTLGLWFKTACANCGLFSVDDDTLGSNDHDRNLYLSGGNMCARVWDDETICTSGANYADGQWHHAAHVLGLSSGGQKIYVDGIEAISGTKTASDFTWQTGVNIGFSSDAAQDYLDGQIDHVVILNRALSQEQVVALKDEAPSLNLHLDEALKEPATAITTTAFANAAGASRNGSCQLAPAQNECGCPAAGSKGWMRQGVVFAGTLYGNDANQCLSVPDGSVPANGLTVGGWFKLSKERWNTDQELVRKPGSYNLFIQRSVSAGGAIKAGFDTSSGRRGPQSVNSVIGRGELMLNQWTHVMASFDPGSGKAYVYLNGALQGDAVSPAPDANPGVPIEIGRNLIGQADEVVLYDRVLSDRDIQALYDYQVHWYDTSFSHEVTIDADAPSVYLDLPADYLANRDTVMAVVADDPSSPVREVTYRVDGGAWANATQDQNTWLFRFNPDRNLGEGPHVIDVRAADSVGHTDENSKTLSIDLTGPSVSLDSAYTLGALEAKDELRLAGAVQDSLSGVDRVYATLLNGSGLAVTGRQLAQLTPGRWEVTFTLSAPLNGQHGVRLEAVDKVGNRSSNASARSRRLVFDPRARWPVTQLAQPVVELDGTSPLADLTEPGPSAYVISGTGLVSGTVSEVPYPTGQVLHMHVEEAEGAARFYDGSASHFQATCPAGACPEAGQAGRYGLGLRLDSGDRLNLGHSARLGDLAGQSGLSVMAWVNLSDTLGLQQILAADTANSANGFGLSVNEAGLQFELYGVGAYSTTSVTLAAGAWTHVAAVVSPLGNDETGVTFYVNGLPLQTITSTLPGLADDDDDWLVGQGLSGQLDELVVYDRALSSAQVQAIANPASSGIDSLELGLLHLRNWDEPALAAWQPVSLTQAGQAFSTWSTQLPAVEGLYKIYLRAADGLSHSLSLPNAWQGEIDTQAPRAQLTHYAPRFPGDRDIYQCWAEDYNLSDRGYACPVAGSAPAYQDAAWHTAVFSQPQLYRYVSPPAYSTNPSPRLTACDTFGACTTVTRTTTTLTWTLGVAILTPTSHSLYTVLAPIEVAGAAYARDSLQDLVVTVDGHPIYTQTWESGTLATPWTTSFTPTAEGAFTVLATLRDRLGNVITSAAPISASSGLETVILVDTSQAGLALTTERISSQNWSNGFIRLEGLVSETTQLASLRIRLDSAPFPNGVWQDIPHSNDYPLVASPWSVSLHSASLIPPGGQTYTVTIRATDGAGRTTELVRSLWADAVPPGASQITLTYASGAIITPAMTVWDVASPTLTAAWTASPSPDTASYTFEWLEQRPGVPSQMVQQTDQVTVTEPRLSTYEAGEPQKLWGRLTSRDEYGNANPQTIGPVYVDYERTPVYVDMGGGETDGQPYRGWLQAPCNLLGEDSRLAERSSGTPQKLYAAWDEAGLRLTWTGANWTTDGDLFIYLDSDPGGGSATAYDPYSAPGDEVYMPTYRVQTTTHSLAADYVLWVQDSVSVTLKHYSGTLWSDVLTPNVAYIFDANLQPAHSDLYVPFSSLGITNPAGTSLSLVAFASDDDGLRLWAAQPPDNPLNSARVTGDTPSGPLALAQGYTWPALGRGVCPKDGLFRQPDVRVSLAAQPAGIPYSLLGNNLPASMAGRLAALIGRQLPQSAVCMANPDDPACKRIDRSARVPFEAQMELARLINIAAPVVGDKQPITVTLTLANVGGAPARDVVAYIHTWGHLRIAITQTAPITLAAGQSSELILNGVIDLAHDAVNDNGWATLDVVVLDDSSHIVAPETYDYPLDWLYVDYELDQAGPDYLEIQSPPGLIGPGEVSVGGFVYDQSNVPTVTLELRAPGGSVSAFTCPDATPADWQWACGVNVGAAGEGQVFDVRVRAADSFAQLGPWFAYGRAGNLNGQPFVVDATPPTVTLGSATAAALSDGWLNAAELNWSGAAFDNRLVDTVMVCDGGDAQPCQAAGVTLAPGALPTTTYVYKANWIQKSIDAAAACGGGDQIEVPFQVEEAFTVVDVSVGLNLTHTRRSDVVAYLYAPLGISVTLLRGGAAVQDYDVLLDDTATVPNWKDTLDHNTASPYYDKLRRSFELLSRLNGQASQGTWRLVVCDAQPNDYDGTLLNSQLTLKSAALPANTTATWQYSLSGGVLDGVAQMRSMYAVDSVGNRSAALSLTYRIDTVAPLITVTGILTSNNVFSLSGSLSDGGEIQALRWTMLSPGGGSQSQVITNQAGGWSVSVSPSPLEEGRYTLWLEAQDVAGNPRRVGPFEMVVSPPPIVVAGVTPADGAVDVIRDQPIVVEFSGPVVTGSIGLTISPSILLTPTWDSAATRLSLEHPNLEAGTLYTVSVVTGTNAAGAWIENLPYTWAFTTVADSEIWADLALAKSSAQANVAAGQSITYAFTIVYSGPFGGTGATLIDAFNSADALAAVSGPGCDWPRGSAVVTCTVNASSGLPTRQVLTVTTDRAYFGPLSNTAIIVLPLGVVDPNPSNNQAGPVVVTVRRVHQIYLPVVIKNG